MSAEPCPTCARPKDEEVEDLYRRLETELRAGAEEERLRIVAWLRLCSLPRKSLIVAAIERGEHVAAQSREGGGG